MKKLVVVSLFAPVILGLAACGGSKTDGNVATNDVVANADDVALDANIADLNATDSNTVDANAAVPVDTVANAK